MTSISALGNSVRIRSPWTSTGKRSETQKPIFKFWVDQRQDRDWGTVRGKACCCVFFGGCFCVGCVGLGVGGGGGGSRYLKEGICSEKTHLSGAEEADSSGTVGKDVLEEPRHHGVARVNPTIIHLG